MDAASNAGGRRDRVAPYGSWTANTAKPVSRTGTGNLYIVGPLYDGLFFIFAPILALLLGILISGTPLANDPVQVFGYVDSATEIFIGSFIMAHLVLVFFRSHGNREIFKLYPYRFTVVPIALFGAMLVSKWALVITMVVSAYWDVYHSSLQTFGLGRIYDVKAGNPPLLGRRLDILLNLLLYVGPIAGGAALMPHLKDFENFKQVGAVFLTTVPVRVESYHQYYTWIVLGLGIPFLFYYVWTYLQLQKQGYNVSRQKVLLLASTGLCSIWTWGFNSFGEAFFIMNFFHAWQYFALVWKYEKRNVIGNLRLGSGPLAGPAALALILASTFGYGFLVTIADPTQTVMALSFVVSIMHFWYDGFIWSVRKKQV